jgi:hypothetical protein
MFVGGYGGCRREGDQELDSSSADSSNVVFFVESKGDNFGNRRLDEPGL